jgi:hypothetical protein
MEAGVIDHSASWLVRVHFCCLIHTCLLNDENAKMRASWTRVFPCWRGGAAEGDSRVPAAGGVRDSTVSKSKLGNGFAHKASSSAEAQQVHSLYSMASAAADQPAKMQQVSVWSGHLAESSLAFMMPCAVVSCTLRCTRSAHSERQENARCHHPRSCEHGMIPAPFEDQDMAGGRRACPL